MLSPKYKLDGKKIRQLDNKNRYIKILNVCIRSRFRIHLLLSTIHFPIRWNVGTKEISLFREENELHVDHQPIQKEDSKHYFISTESYSYIRGRVLQVLLCYIKGHASNYLNL